MQSREKTNIDVAKMESESEWTSAFINVGLNFEISCNTSLGLLWQTPVFQRYAYRPTTLMGSIEFRF